MKILITGAKGMLGRTLTKELPSTLSNTTQSTDVPVKIIGCDIDDFDITSIKETSDFFKKIKPDIVIHCAAMTDVDGCESNFEKAMAVNAIGTANIASCCQKLNSRLIAISTDYVFGGTLDRPYNEWDETKPVTAYGKSKLAAEQAVINHCADSAILRIAWLYGSGGPSFYHTMVKLGSQNGEPLKVVSDQIGNPTSTNALVPIITHFINNKLVGIFHSTCEGEATWYDFACEIFKINNLKREIIPCSSDQYPRPAKRPENSRLDKMGLRLAKAPSMIHWKTALKKFTEKEHK